MRLPSGRPLFVLRRALAFSVEFRSTGDRLLRRFSSKNTCGADAIPCPKEIGRSAQSLSATGRLGTTPLTEDETQPDKTKEKHPSAGERLRSRKPVSCKESDLEEKFLRGWGPGTAPPAFLALKLAQFSLSNIEECCT